MPVRFWGKKVELVQPDGTTLPVVGWGNQHEAVLETHDGYTVLQDPATGFYEYAKLDEEGIDLRPSGIAPSDLSGEAAGLTKSLRKNREAATLSAREGSGLRPGGTRWEQRIAQSRKMLSRTVAPAAAPPAHTTSGKCMGVVLLVQFPDVPGTIQQVEVDAFCNRRGYGGFGNNGSVRDYFLDVSGAKLDYTNIVTPYYTAKHPRAYYTNQSVAQPVRARELIREALLHWRENGFDFGASTLDDEGYVRAVNVFYAGRCVNGWSKGLWPHSYHLGRKMPLGEDRYAFDYQITNMGDELCLGTFCHENGHMMCDFPDLYDYGGQSSGVGAFCLMCGGNYDEKNPTQVCGYLKYRAGWGSAQTATPGRHELHAGTNEFVIHRRNDVEYFLVENRAKVGRDASLPAAGLAIWHVDENGNNEWEQGTLQRHYECSLEQADGRRDLEGKRDELGDSGDLFGGASSEFSLETTPSSAWWDGVKSGLDISGVGDPGETVTFRVK